MKKTGLGGHLTLSVRAIVFVGLLTLTVAGRTVLPEAAKADSHDNPIKVLSADAITEFPEGMRFKLSAESTSDITSVAVRFRSTAQTSGIYEYLKYERGTLVDGELFWRTNTGARYIPPGTMLKVRFEIEDLAGNFLETPLQDFIYYDSRFTWKEVSEGPVTVAYHGPVKTRADNVLRTLVDTLLLMGPVLGADIDIPIRVTLFNNNLEMLGALPPRSETIGRELITEGQAFSDHNTLLILGSSRLALGTAGHEVVHILTHRAGDSIFRNVPSWLDEGLAEFGNPEPGFSYDIALDFASETDRLLPVVYMQGLPGDPEDVIIFYGQSRSIVQYMLSTYGAPSMRVLMAELQKGTRMDLALEKVYGFDREGLDRQWRESIGAPEYVPPEQGGVRPTAVPLPTLQLYSLTPQPLVTDEPEPMADARIAEEPTEAPEPESSDTTDTTREETPSGGGCNAGPDGATGMMDLSAVALAIGLAGMGLRRRLLRR